VLSNELAPSPGHAGLLAADVAVTTRVFAAITGQSAAAPPAALRVGADRSRMEHPTLQPAVAATLRDALTRMGQAFSVIDVDGPC